MLLALTLALLLWWFGPWESSPGGRSAVPAEPQAVVARGALAAARWVQGRRGWFTMHDVLGLRPDPWSPKPEA